MRKNIFIIAEAGINHNGDMKRAKEMVDAAAEAGADAIKFQTYKTEKLLSPKTPMAEYQQNNVNDVPDQFEMLKRCELSFEQFKKLKKYCDSKNIEFISSPFDEESADFLDSILNIFKIPSGEINNIPFLKHIAQKGKPIILSTGMSYMNEVEKAVTTIQKEQNSHKPQEYFVPLTVLHCTSSYPCRFENANLSAITTLRKKLKLPTGFSDHTTGIEAAIAAAALGSVVIEKHFTLDKKLPGPDHKASITAAELKKMVKSVRNIEKAIGSPQKQPSEEEIRTAKLVRKSLIAARNIKKGKKISRQDISIKRPAVGLAPEYLEKVIGRKSIGNIKKETPLSKEMFEDK